MSDLDQTKTPKHPFNRISLKQRIFPDFFRRSKQAIETNSFPALFSVLTVSSMSFKKIFSRRLLSLFWRASINFLLNISNVLTPLDSGNGIKALELNVFYKKSVDERYR